VVSRVCITSQPVARPKSIYANQSGGGFSVARKPTEPQMTMLLEQSPQCDCHLLRHLQFLTY